ncbi:MAG: preprotein translocase subunit SecG [Eubacterium sp.]|nr:preprotein translocase subunit SecG [Eubacterium sp.]
MIILRIVSVIFLIISLILTVVILLQEGKQAGLGGTISGAAETYWGKNKGRSWEGKLETITKICIVLFFILAVVLNIEVFTGLK